MHMHAQDYITSGVKSGIFTLRGRRATDCTFHRNKTIVSFLNLSIFSSLLIGLRESDSVSAYSTMAFLFLKYGKFCIDAG